ncbi:MAG: hypothetical protein AB1403_22910 [Candidatus Riflebacteria bacterium]
MFKRGLLLILFCVCGLNLFAENKCIKDYPGMSVVVQEMENHQEMLETLEHLLVHLSKNNQPEKASIESLLNYTKAALISLEYLDSVWASKGKRLPPNNKPEVISASVPCACNGQGMCAACGGDGYVWTGDEEGKEKKCKKCKGTGRVGGMACSGCQGSGWANAHPNSPSRTK